MNTWIVALAGLGFVLATRKKGSPLMPEDTVKPGEGEPQLALASGDPKDLEIAALLIEFDDYLASNGAGRYTCAEEFFQMPEAPRIDGRRPVAIAPRNLWPNAIPTLRAFDDLRAQWGRPLPIRGYRPVDYNAAVGGAPRSIHQWGGAIDIKLKQAGYTASERQDFAVLAARYTLDNPAAKWGFGVYNDPPTTVHLDTGYQRRSWENGATYLDLARQGNA